MKLNIGKRFDPRLAGELKTQRASIVKGVACAAITGALSALFLVFARQAVAILKEAGSPKGIDMWALSRVCGEVVMLFVIKYWFTRGQSYYLSRASARLSASLRQRMFAKLLRLPVSYFSKRRSGAIQSVLTNDVGVYQSAVTIVRDSIDGPIKAIGAFIVIIKYAWPLALASLLVMPVFVLVIQNNARKMKVAQREVQESLAEMNAATHEGLAGTRVLKAFAAESRFEAYYRTLVETNFNSQMVATRRTAALRPLVELIGAVGIAVILFLAGVLSAHGMIKVEDIFATVLALDTVNQGVRNMASVNNTYAQVQAAAERIYTEILDVPEEHLEARGNLRPETSDGRIEFRNVTFRYPDGTEALSNVSFVLEPGTSLALVGPSGAGKSTIADLILRFYDPTEGQVLFDGIDIRELDVAWLREQIGVVPQFTFLFGGSISENLRMARPAATDEEIHRAVGLAHAEEFVTQLPQRYDTPVGEQGIRLSGGQRQRVAIARALVREPALLLLDEATSALDAESERAVTEALDEVMQQRTTLFIAHRLTTAARADRILVMSRGEAIEMGSHSELLEKGGAYAGLFKAFSGGVL